MRPLRLFATLLVLLLSGVACGGRRVPSFEDARGSFVKSDSLLLDRHGAIIHELRTDPEGRRLEWTSLGDVSPALKTAVAAAEDGRFYRHRGVDFRSLGAALAGWAGSKPVRGASTITMQLASLLDGELAPANGRRTLRQKAGQIRAAWEIEKSWSKGEILEAYLNLVTFRGELQGVAAASRGLFGKETHGLDSAESLVLASLIRAPAARAPAAAERAVRLAASLGWDLDPAAVEAAAAEALSAPPRLGPRRNLAPHVARRVLKGAGSDARCTLDGSLQRFSAERLEHQLGLLGGRNVSDGALVVADNASGEVLACVSVSGEPERSAYVDGTRAKRQAGSTLKPFLYALAFDGRLLTPASLLEDSPIDVAVPGGVYQPGNYDGDFKGLVSARTALASSLNVPAVRVLSLVGNERFLRALGSLGVAGLSGDGNFYGPSLALGTADVTLWELVGAYRALANGGAWSPLRLLPAEGADGRETHAAEAGAAPGHGGLEGARRVFSPEAAYLVSDILSDREARSLAFGLENPLATRFWTAVKTGTSKDMRDNWCVGYTAGYTVGVWVGNFSGDPMWNVSGMSGAAPVWVEVASLLSRAGMGGRPEPPPSLVRSRVEFPSGPGASGGSAAGKRPGGPPRGARCVEPPRDEWFIPGTEPVGVEQRIGVQPPGILYPREGTVIALDPDVPEGRQVVFFVASRSCGEGAAWTLNGSRLGGAGAPLPWHPSAGAYTLALTDGGSKILDAVGFEVRGSEEPTPER